MPSQKALSKKQLSNTKLDQLFTNIVSKFKLYSGFMAKYVFIKVNFFHFDCGFFKNTLPHMAKQNYDINPNSQFVGKGVCMFEKKIFYLPYFNWNF